jgi:ABC-type oligopeptide transport system substrate-binding subunit
MDFAPFPRHVVEAFGADWYAPEHLVTNGPFRLAAWETDVRSEHEARSKQVKRILLERNPTFRGRFSGNLQQVELAPVNEEELHDPAAYEQDRLDILLLNTQEDLLSLRAQHSGNFVDKSISGNIEYTFKRISPPFNDRRVRQAFVHAVDRQALANIICHGNVTPLTGGFFSPVYACHLPGIALAYDPERARSLLAEAGYPGGKGFPEISVWTENYYLDISKFIQSQWRDNLGLSTSWTVPDISFPFSEVWEDAQAFPDILCWGSFPVVPDPILYLAAAINPESLWHDEYLDRLCKVAVRKLDPVERLRYIQAYDRYITEEAWQLQFYYPRTQLLVKPWVKAYPHNIGPYVYWRHVILEPHE